MYLLVERYGRHPKHRGRSTCKMLVRVFWRQCELVIDTVTLKMKGQWLYERRQYEQTDEFRTKYYQRSGIEAKNSILKRVTGMGRLRVCGRAAAFSSILLKVAGWNILREASAHRLLDRLRESAEFGDPEFHAASLARSSTCEFSNERFDLRVQIV